MTAVVFIRLQLVEFRLIVRAQVKTRFKTSAKPAALACEQRARLAVRVPGAVNVPTAGARASLHGGRVFDTTGFAPFPAGLARPVL